MRRRRAPHAAAACLLVLAASVAAIISSRVVAHAAATWTLVSSPNPGTTGNMLTGVTCPDAMHCWAVGVQNSGTSGTSEQTLIEQWDGTTWSAVPSANVNSGPSLQENILSAVACTSTTNCWAVGVVIGAGSLFEHWNGTAWTASTLTSGGSLVGVSCVDASNCWAVGYIGGSGGGVQAWIEQWNGTNWVNDTVSDAGLLGGVSCVDASHCWAVGETTGTSSPSDTLIEAWNGTSWSQQPSPNAVSGFNHLNAVSCATASSCWAVGEYYATGNSGLNLIEGWNGASWSIPSGLSNSDVNTPLTTNGLGGVVCTSVVRCWAVGQSITESAGNPDFAGQTLVDQFDGTSWSLVPNTPDATIGSANSDELLGVACGDPNHCAAVGDLRHGDVGTPLSTLILMLQTASAPPPPTPTPTSLPIPVTGSAVDSASAGGVPLGAPLTMLGALAVVGGASLIQTQTRRRR